MQEQEKNNPSQPLEAADGGAEPAQTRKGAWKSALSWVCALPWGRIAGALCRFLRRWLIPAVCWVLALGVALGAFALIISAAVCNKTDDRIVTLEELAEAGIEADCIVVLGCKVYPDGRLSHMLSDRVETAVSLYHAGVSERLLMSGDNQEPYYNEVGPMRDAAIAGGVATEAIEIDAMGLSTYDSIARIAEEYRGRRIVIVTQRYHLFRALYIAEKMGIEAYGVSADLRTYRERARWEMREVLARCKDVFYVETRHAVAGIPENAQKN